MAWAATIPAGLCLSGWGLWTANQSVQPSALRWLAAALAPVGLALAFAGVLGVAVPGFYSG